MPSREHWNDVYTTRHATAVSWYQAHQARSLELIREIAHEPTAAIIDVGGGAATLVDDLLADGYRNLSVLDVSDAALQLARRRLGPASARVHWIAGDVTTMVLPEQAYDVWHDRAVFHFLIGPADREAYVAQLTRALRPGGHVVVATFAPDGPTECSGLPVMRYAPETLHAAFGPAFDLVAHSREAHTTPAGQVQRFVYCHFIKH